jgi:hypothetical protein
LDPTRYRVLVVLPDHGVLAADLRARCARPRLLDEVQALYDRLPA